MIISKIEELFHCLNISIVHHLVIDPGVHLQSPPGSLVPGL